jgi:hypothetical protein
MDFRHLAVLGVFLSGCSSVGDAVVDVSAPFTQPEGALHDPAADVYLISNVVGAPLDHDNNGYITVLDPSGTVRAPRFIAGGQSGVELDAPKGMAILGDTLFVADIDKIRRFDRGSGRPKETTVIEGASFLNDVLAWDEGSILVSDTMKNRITLVEASGAARTWAENSSFGGANGLARAPDGVWVVGYTDGSISKLSKSGQLVSRTQGPPELDGAVTLGGALFVSSWKDKAVFRVDEKGEADKILRGLESAADIALDGKRNRLLVPLMMPSRVLVFEVSQ